jgi:hypothetical protein
VEAAAAPTLQQQEGFIALSIPLGTGSPLSCLVYSEPLDAGGALYRMLELVGQNTDVRLARTTDVRLLGDSPAVFAEAQYLVDVPAGKAAGQIELMVYTSDQTPLVCTHDELGYSESFARVTSGLARSLQGAGEEKPTPLYAEFHVLRLKGHPVGFEKRVMREVAGGSRLTEVERSFIFPRSEKALKVQDVVSTELADKDGVLVARDYARATDGELDLQMSLEQVKGREYRYEGKQGGKDLSGTFTATRDLSTDPGSARVVREQLLSGKQRELTLQSYSPSSNPSGPTTQVWRKASAEGRELTVEQGEVKVSVTVDAQGMPEKLVVPLGELQLVQERVSVSGTP